jgi:hypothetical protein
MRCFVGGRRLSSTERAEILRVYFAEGREAADKIAAGYGLSPWYAYKLANQSGRLPITRWSGTPTPPIQDDPLIDMSPAQKKMRVAKLRAELLTLGYDVVQLHHRAYMEAAE